MVGQTGIGIGISQTGIGQIGNGMVTPQLFGLECIPPELALVSVVLESVLFMVESVSSSYSVLNWKWLHHK